MTFVVLVSCKSRTRAPHQDTNSSSSFAYFHYLQSNISMEEYRKMLHVYEESVVQTEIVGTLRKAMESEPAIQQSLPRKSQLRPTGLLDRICIHDVMPQHP